MVDPSDVPSPLMTGCVENHEQCRKAFSELQARVAVESDRCFRCGDVYVRGEPCRCASVSAADDAVNHPSHYTHGSVECIDAIESALTPDEFAGFCKGNSLKYLWRAGRKGSAVEDLRKARWYQDRAIKHAAGDDPPQGSRD